MHAYIIQYSNKLSISQQGVIQDFEIEGGNEKSNQKMLLKKGQLLFQYPAYGHSVIIERGGKLELGC